MNILEIVYDKACNVIDGIEDGLDAIGKVLAPLSAPLRKLDDFGDYLRASHGSYPDQIPNQRLEERLSGSELVQDEKRKKYGILLAGHAGYGKWRMDSHIALAYQTLLQEGFDKDNIFVLDSNGYQYHNRYPIDGKATKDNLQKILSKISRGIGKNDLFFLFTTSHGGVKDNKSYLCLLNEQLSSRELERYLMGIRPKNGVLVFNACHSGSFARGLGRGPFIAISATSETGIAVGSAVPNAFFGAFKHPYKADRNNDGEVSVKEAFDYCLGKCRKGFIPILVHQTPQFVSQVKDPEKVTLR